MCMYSNTAISMFPGLAINAMENGGMCFTDDGEYQDAADLPLDPGRIWLDFENGDGARGHIPLSVEDNDTDLDGPETEQEELERLTAEQAADDAQTIYVVTRPEDTEDASDTEEINPSHSGGTRREIRKPEDGGRLEWHCADVNYKNAKMRIAKRETRKYSERGRNDLYKDRGLRSAGSGKTHTTAI